MMALAISMASFGFVVGNTFGDRAAAGSAILIEQANKTAKDCVLALRRALTHPNPAKPADDELQKN